MSFIFNLLVFLILVSTIHEVTTDNIVNKKWYWFIIAMMMLTAGLAYGVSPDWVAYWRAFEGVAAAEFTDLGILTESFDMEFGYLLLNKLVSSVGLGYAAFTLVIAIIAMYLKGITIYKYGGYVYLALLMYFVPTFLFEEHVHVRQGLANAVMFYSIRYIIEKRFWKFLLCFVIAFLFHKAVAPFLFAYWIARIRLNNVTIISLVGGAVILNTTGIADQIGALAEMLPFGVSDAYLDYANETMERGVLGDTVKIITVAIILLLNNRVVKEDPLFPIFRNIYIVGIFMYFFFGQGIFAARLPGFFTVYIVFVVPRMIYALRENRMLKNFIFIGFTVYTMLLYVNFYNNWAGKSGFADYTTVFNKWVPYDFIRSK